MNLVFSLKLYFYLHYQFVDFSQAQIYLKFEKEIS